MADQETLFGRQQYAMEPHDALAMNGLSGNVMRPLVYSRVSFYGIRSVTHLGGKLEKLADVPPTDTYNQVNSLQRSGLLQATEVPQDQRRVASTGRLRERAVMAPDSERYMPVAGVLLRWSLINARTTEFLGRTTFDRHDVRTPVATTEMLMGLLDTPHVGEIAVPEFSRSRAAASPNRILNLKNERAMALVELGLLEREDGGRFFKILDPTPRHKKPLSRPTQAAYEVLGVAFEQFDRERDWTPDSLVELAIESGIVRPEETETIRKMKNTLSQAAAPERSDIMRGAVEQAPLRKTAYRLTPTFKPAAEDFVERIESLAQPHARVAAAMDAVRISYNRQNVNQLRALYKES